MNARCWVIAVVLSTLAYPLELTAASPPNLPEIRTEALFKEWATTRKESIEAYDAHLRANGVGDVVPLQHLLRTSSDWYGERCKRVNAPAFEVPPAATWINMIRTLKLLKHLQEQGILPAFEVVSAYRNQTVNKCSKSTGTRHPKAAAVDLLPKDGRSSADLMKALCRFYWQEGKTWNMGLSLYPTNRIHVDADGHRTWGADTTFRTSACRR